MGFFTQGCNCSADLAIQGCPTPGENDGSQHPDGICLERRKVSEHSLLREHKPDCLAEPCEYTKKNAAPGLTMRRIRRLLMREDDPANPCQCQDNTGDLQDAENLA